jgi:Uncharacterised protein family (UPF0175)
MNVTLEFPDELAAGMGIEASALPRAMLEAFAGEGYREGRMSAKQVRILLGHDSRWETEDFLSAHGAWPGLRVEEAVEDSRSLSALLRR